MLLTALGLALVVAAAFFVAWPMLKGEEASPSGETEAPLAGRVRALESRRDAALSALKEAEFDHQVGKLSDEDYAALRAELETRALEDLAALDVARSEDATIGTRGPEGRSDPAHHEGAPAGTGEESRRMPAVKAGGGGSARAGRFCAACGRRNPSDKRFCAGCGKPLAGAVERPRRRA